MLRKHSKENEALKEIVERLEEIRDEIGFLNKEALDLTKTASKILRTDRLYEGAKVYWYAHIEGNAVGEQHRGSMENLPDTIEKIVEYIEGESDSD